MAQRGKQLRQGLVRILELYPDHFQEVRGWGLMQGLVIKESSDLVAQDVVLEALNYNLLLIPAGPKVIRLVPPLIIKKNEINQCLKRLENSIKSKI